MKADIGIENAARIRQDKSLNTTTADQPAKAENLHLFHGSFHCGMLIGTHVHCAAPVGRILCVC